MVKSSNLELVTWQFLWSSVNLEVLFLMSYMTDNECKDPHHVM